MTRFVMMMSNPSRLLMHRFSGMCLLFAIAVPAGWGAEEPAWKYEVSGKDLRVHFSEDGRVTSVALGSARAVRPVRAFTALANCEQDGPVKVEDPGDETLTFTRKMVLAGGKHSCKLRERFLPGKQSVRWEIEIAGDDAPWSTAIETHLEWPNTPALKYWMAREGERTTGFPLHFESADPGKKPAWSDPLQLMPLQDLELRYGALPPLEGFCLPLVALIEPDQDLGLSLAGSPEDLPALMDFRMRATGDLQFSRRHLRISQDKVLRFAIDLVAHEADWRPALGWMVARYPRFFDPPNPQAAALAGCGAFSSSFSGKLDAAALKAMGARVNWGFGFTFPYVGMYLPYVEPDSEWTSFEGRKQSSTSLQTLATGWKAAGIETLAYFSTTEWGYKTLDGKRITADDSNAPTLDPGAFAEEGKWKDPTRFLLEKLPGAILFDAGGKPVFSALDVPEANVVVDPGEPVMAAYLTDQARRWIERVPAISGICIDRMDWLERYNPRRDDGVSWINDRTARSLRMSWLEITGQLGSILHGSGKSMFVNPHTKRLDLMEHVDGIFDEYGYIPHNQNTTALLAVRKPALGWTPGEAYLRQDVDGFFQRHLHLGLYPMAPFPENGTAVKWLHAIQPGAWAEQQYRDYAPLLDANQGKQWVLHPHVVRARNDAAKVNLFAVNLGHALPVTFAKGKKAVIELRRFKGLPKQPVFDALHPGQSQPVEVEVTPHEDFFEIGVPVSRGCAMVRIRAGSEASENP